MLLDEVGQYVHDSGIASFDAVAPTGPTSPRPLFLGWMPDSPDDLVALREYSGAPPTFTMSEDGSPQVAEPNLQVTVRCRHYDEGRAIIERIYRLLASVVERDLYWIDTVGVVGVAGTRYDVRYHSITPLQDPFGLGEDDNGRTILACNFRVMRKVQPA